ncbi:hypothetical protein OFN68_02355 [Campylobacter sp. JMF_07 ED4]|uniref:hypothetical protein n=1 Tax=unclassified Campylobacter TaxID=2593542 RepID=UPI0022E9C7A0|nr:MULTISPECIES: hypothetical protein [unclassified Campylobacter]MDA3044434.1 hypothetical protein [Campylobacter sp. JMF_07 ED4]MDA3071410.1 hypothetical protein [Campylobacter sp. VBCF_03 NA9]MDA3077325.1 hypothetical protein [Campylobacter sp. JMF_06 NA1]
MNKPIRMCVICRGRFAKAGLNAFVQNFKKENSKRQFYICNQCINQKEKIIKYLSKFRKYENFEIIKERVLNG